jgi:hypothetical protein
MSKALAKAVVSRRERDNLTQGEWKEIADILEADRTLDCIALARLEGLLRSVGPKRVAARRA